ncbi:DUF4468 domain-containing protein [Draconibacterium orientale]|uniref:DUF4468 domain-containing protein n=1 Tax=Draconibacterium orientale TaxID=1168034 RepID=UPI0029C08176|nr:DUF4468 domain-containing protein [Draconibacterium orientale]
MRKLLLTIVLAGFFASSYSQHKIIQEKFPVYEGVITKENTNKTELFLKLKEWVAISFKSAKDVIQFEDKEIGKIVSKGNSSYSINNGTTILNETVYFTLTLETKDNRFKYTLEFTSLKSSGIDAPIEKALVLDLESINNLKYVGKKFKQKAIESQKSTVKQREENYKEISSTLIQSLLNVGKVESSDDW